MNKSTLKKINDEAMTDVTNYELKKVHLAQLKAQVDLIEYEMSQAKAKAAKSLKKLKKALDMKDYPETGLRVLE